MRLARTLLLSAILALAAAPAMAQRMGGMGHGGMGHGGMGHGGMGHGGMGHGGMAMGGPHGGLRGGVYRGYCRGVFGGGAGSFNSVPFPFLPTPPITYLLF